MATQRKPNNENNEVEKILNTNTNNKASVPQNDTDIKVSGEPQFYGENGARRNSAEGKGRFDLIPTEPFRFLIARLKEGGVITCTKEAITAAAFEGRIYDTIIALTIYAYDMRTLGDKPLQEHQVHDFVHVFNDMLIDLAKHFEKGAKIYGERNCQKGIPAWRFRDSGLRHLNQYFAGLDDEPHMISAIWNFWMLAWTDIVNGRGANTKPSSDKQHLILGDLLKDIADTLNRYPL